MKEYVDGWCGSWFLIFQELVLSITTNFALLVFHMLTVLLTCRRLEYGRDFSINFSLPSLYWRRHHLHLSLECSFPSSFFLHLFLSLWELPPFAPSFIITWTLYFCMFSPVPSFLPYFLSPLSSSPFFCRFVLKSPWSTLVNLLSLTVLRSSCEMPLLEVLGGMLSVLRTCEGQVPFCWNKWSFTVRPSWHNGKTQWIFLLC